MPPVKSGIIVLSLFAAAWCAAGLSAIGAPPAAAAVPAAVALLLVYVAARLLKDFQQDPEEKRRSSRLVGLWTAVELAAMAAAAVVLINRHELDLLVPVGAAIVGLHFLPLAAGMPRLSYWFTGVGLILAAAAGVVLPAGTGVPAVCFAASGILTLTALHLIGEARRRAAQPRPA